LKGKRRGKFTKGVLFLHENTPVHQALASNPEETGLSGLTMS
jgi:hypothetical protein